jgi:hypothetical protein
MSFFNNLSTLFGAQGKAGGQPRKSVQRPQPPAPPKPARQNLRQVPVQPLTSAVAAPQPTVQPVLLTTRVSGMRVPEKLKQSFRNSLAGSGYSSKLNVKLRNGQQRRATTQTGNEVRQTQRKFVSNDQKGPTYVKPRVCN